MRTTYRMRAGRFLGILAAGLIILGVAVVKAVCLATYFMHLKWDWNRL